MNGEYFLEFVARNNLVIGNSTDLCEGTITRKRCTVNGTEESILDYFVMCQELSILLKSMKIDESRNIVLSRYSKLNGQTIVKKSDHNILYCKFNQSWTSKVHRNNERYEIFNFKDFEGIKKFHDLTSSTTLSRCFKDKDIISESKQWLKNFKNILQRSFKKIRITKPRQNSEVIAQMREKACMMQKLETLQKCLEMSGHIISKDIISKMVLISIEIEEIDISISNLISNRNVKKIREHFSSLTDSGNFSATNMWRLKKKLHFKASEMPAAKKDLAGNLITTKQGLLQLYKNTYIDRLSPKDVRKEYETLQNMKEALFRTRYQISSLTKSDNWSADQVQKICKGLHNSKARDALGWVYELFKPPYAGHDLYQSLTKMFNGIKEELKIPSFFEEMVITSFFKNKGLQSELKNQRGVFNVVKLRSIYDKLIYSDTYPTIDGNLSCSNVGGRRGRNIRDHLFTIYAIINDVKNGSAESIDLQGYDIEKCFDEMNYEETHNDLWDVGVQNDKFAVISKLDEKAKVVVKTPSGTTDKFELTNLIMQGTVFAPIKCSIQIDTLGRDCLTNGDGLYQYKNIIEVPALSMVDDVIGITTCSDEAVKLNAIINVKMESKKLRLSQDKCFKLHISKKKNNQCSTILKSHEKDIKSVKSATYLGDILNEEGTIDETVKSRKDKSIGRISQIVSIISSISLGMFYMDISLILRESMLLNGILTNSEVWFNVKEEHLTLLESADNDLMRQIFNAHAKTAIELFFLETAKIPIRYIISKRRLMYFWQILRQNENELIKKVYDVQETIYTKGDWCQMIKSELIKYDIQMSHEEICKMSKYRFRKLVDKKVNSYVFQYLKEKAASHSKSLKILKEIKNKSVMRRPAYLKENTFFKTDCQLLFKLRSQMLEVKTNFSHQYENDTSCRTCRVPGMVENEEHLLLCEGLKDEIKNKDVKFDFVYGTMEQQKQALSEFKAVLRKRDFMLKYQER